jgi:hypothetical protein
MFDRPSESVEEPAARYFTSRRYFWSVLDRRE